MMALMTMILVSDSARASLEMSQLFTQDADGCGVESIRN